MVYFGIVVYYDTIILKFVAGGGTGMSQDHFWSICTYPFSTNVGLNGQLLVPNLVDLVPL